MMAYPPENIHLWAYPPSGNIGWKDYTGDDNLDLDITHQTPEGDWECTFKLCNYSIRTSEKFGWFIYVFDEAELFYPFVGIVVSIDPDYGNNVKITAVGHGHTEGSSSFLRD